MKNESFPCLYYMKKSSLGADTKVTSETNKFQRHDALCCGCPASPMLRDSQLTYIVSQPNFSQALLVCIIPARVGVPDFSHPIRSCAHRRNTRTCTRHEDLEPNVHGPQGSQGSRRTESTRRTRYIRPSADVDQSSFKRPHQADPETTHRHLFIVAVAGTRAGWW